MRKSDFMWSVLAFIVIAIILSISSVVAIIPSGANMASIANSTALSDAAGYFQAFAGNVSEISIYGYTTTQAWQGFFGNVTGTVQLADVADNIMYNWSLMEPEGEVYASTNVTVQWQNIQCYNHTAIGNYSDDSLQRGQTSQFGTNMTILETQFGILYDDVDGVNETFFASIAHDEFYTNNMQFSQGECLSTRIFSNASGGFDNYFEETVLYDPDGRSIVFTSILDEESPIGFDGNRHDFEMLVLENGHGTNNVSTTYYFWVELE